MHGYPAEPDHSPVQSRYPSELSSGKFATATCPAGKRAIGSGGQVGGLAGSFPNEVANVVITFLEPSDEKTVPGSVTAFAYEQPAIATSWRLQVTALCANVS